MRYLVDTNCLLDNPEIIVQYDTVIPSSVLREIEDLEKKRRSDRTLQYNIRKLKRFLDENENHIYYDLKDYKFSLDDDLDSQYVDNILLQVCVDNGYHMITNDRLLREKCKLYGIEVVNPKTTTYVEHKGFREKLMTQEELKNVYLNLGINQFDLMTNEYIIINDDISGDLLDIMKWNGEHLISLRDKRGKLGKGFKTFQFGDFVPKDEYQIMAVDSIMNNQLTCIRGRAGSGKSLIALNTAWYLVEKEGYRLVIFANASSTKDSVEYGYYKGTRLEKLISSSLGTMLKAKFGDEIEIIRHIQDGKLDIIPFSDLRGYDTSNQKTICYVTESQNLTSYLLKLGLQRISEETKVIIDGDYSQIDKDVYATDNGMKRMSEVFRGLDLYGEVELQNVWRSRIADISEQM